MDWHALRVRSRYEQVVKRSLHGKEHEEFLPTYRSTSQWADRLKLIDRPLFPGYIFSRFSLEDRLSILQIPGVVEIIGNGKTPVDPVELAAIQQLVASGIPLMPWPFVDLGHRVRVREGPFRGIEGVIQRFKQQHRLVVGVSLLQRAVSIELDASSVERVAVPRILPQNDVTIRMGHQRAVNAF